MLLLFLIQKTIVTYDKLNNPDQSVRFLVDSENDVIIDMKDQTIYRNRFRESSLDLDEDNSSYRNENTIKPTTNKRKPNNLTGYQNPNPYEFSPPLFFRKDKEDHVVIDWHSDKPIDFHNNNSNKLPPIFVGLKLLHISIQ